MFALHRANPKGKPRVNPPSVPTPNNHCAKLELIGGCLTCRHQTRPELRAKLYLCNPIRTLENHVKQCLPTCSSLSLPISGSNVTTGCASGCTKLTTGSDVNMSSTNVVNLHWTTNKSVPHSPTHWTQSNGTNSPFGSVFPFHPPTHPSMSQLCPQVFHFDCTAEE